MASQRRNKNSDWISASDVGRAAYCPRSVALKYAGAKPSARAMDARKRGDLKHEEFNRQATKDRRCYVASYLYGVDDPRTEILRQFRDRHIKRVPGGHYLIQCYYRVSPMVIGLSERIPIAGRIIRKVVDRLVSWCLQRSDLK